MKSSNDLVIKKLKEFSKMDKIVHVVLKDSKKFYNGKVKSVSKEFFVVEDRMAGLMPIFYEEIFKVEPYETIK